MGKGAGSAQMQFLQDELDLPAPAISLAGDAGFQLWFSLADPVSEADGRQFLACLRDNYLGSMPEHQLTLIPGAQPAPATVDLIPRQETGSERWLAFIDPSLGSMFMDETWLEMPPAPERQASLLAGLKSIPPEAFQRVLALAASVPADTPAVADNALPLPVTTQAEPFGFLLFVMNDERASLDQRIRAAEALLPYFTPPARQ